MELLKQLDTYDIDTIIETFGLETPDQCAVLDSWLTAHYTLNEMELHLATTCHQRTIKYGSLWNEEELKINLIGLLFLIADLEIDRKIKTFYERPIKAIVQEYSLNVISDCLVATPRGKGGSPKAPYFFLQEFKKHKGEKNDPEGQMLVAMLIAQELNKDDKPIYGAWTSGNDWFFTTLVGNSYCQSHQYSAPNKEDLFQIIFALRKLKELII
jgi:hypothetical protein